MRIVLLPLIILFFQSELFCQNDDYPDYRSKRESFVRILEKDIRSDIASFAIGGLDESVGLNPLHTIPVSAITNNSITFTDNKISVRITTKAFTASQHKLSFYDEPKTYLVKIDNKPYFGDYGKVPKTIVDSVQIIMGRDTVNVPQTALNDLANPILSFTENGKQKTNNKVYLSADGRKIYVYMLKTELGGSYEVTWIIQDKQYIKRVVDFGFLK